jgi:hypothetical protein
MDFKEWASIGYREDFRPEMYHSYFSRAYAEDAARDGLEARLLDEMESAGGGK